MTGHAVTRMAEMLLSWCSAGHIGRLVDFIFDNRQGNGKVTLLRQLPLHSAC